MPDRSFKVSRRWIASAAVRRAISIFAVIFALSVDAFAAEQKPCDLAVAESAAVSGVTDSGGFDLADGRHVRLAGIQTPLLSLGRANIVDWPLAVEAKERLSSLVLGKSIGLAFESRGVDRHGDIVAYVIVGTDEKSLQQILIEEGHARVQTRSDVRRCAAQWLKAETEARKAKRGIWADAFYRVRKPEELDADIGTFQIVEGKILSFGEYRDRLFLNFGSDYRTDFTVTISPRDRKRLVKDGIDPTMWSGKSVQVRGWIALLNGPELELTHGEQVQVLESAEIAPRPVRTAR